MRALMWFAEPRRRWANAAVAFEPRGPALAVGRALLALAQLATFAFNSDDVLFALPDGMRCNGLGALSMWCLAQNTDPGLLVIRIVSISVLLVVLSGYRPRLTCVPHWYVVFSMTVAMPVANGGDRALQVATLLLVPVCLGDDRTWQWARPRMPLPAQWRGASCAAGISLRLQLSVIYLSAFASKLADPLWRQGSAMLVVAHHHVSGFPRPVLNLLEPALRSYWIVAVASWLVIAVQLVIAVLLWGGPRARQCALVLGVGLHAGIMFLMSLPVFGLVMISLLVVVCAPRRQVVRNEGTDDDREDRTRSVRSGSSGAD